MPAIERDGQRIEFEVRGAGARTVLFAHNLFCDRSVFGLHAARLAEQYRTVNVDLRGHGGSRGVRGRFATTDLAADLVAVLDAVGAARASVVGLSLGASAAMELALAHPARLDALVLMGASAFGPGPGDALANAVTAAVVRAVGPRTFIARRVLRVLFGASFRAEAPERVAPWLARVRGLAPRDAARALRAWGTRRRLIERLARVRVPTLVVVGDEDVACPLPHGAAIRAAIPGATLARVARAGHTMPLERPDETLALVAGFLAALPPRTVPPGA